jgi:hypothetical protein
MIWGTRWKTLQFLDFFAQKCMKRTDNEKAIFVCPSACFISEAIGWIPINFSIDSLH